MAIEFIYFDFGNVLCYFDHAQAARQVAEVSGVPIEQVRDVIFGDGGLQWKYETGAIDDAAFHADFCRQTGAKIELATLYRANSDIFRLNHSILPLVAHLADSGLPLGILSNTSPGHWRWATDGRFAILNDAFREHVLSYEVGAAKPEEKIYRHAIELAGVPAGNILYIDDIPGHIAAGKQAGLDGIVYTTTVALIDELLRRGVRCNV